MSLKKITQKQKVLGYLKTKKQITPLKAFYAFSILGGLSKVISRLRDDGYLIETKMTQDVNKFNEPVKYATYIYRGKLDGDK